MLNSSPEQISLLKNKIFQAFSFCLNGIPQNIIDDKNSSFQDKSKKINNAINAVIPTVQKQFIDQSNLDQNNKAIMALIIQYCYSCLCIEKRHQVWKYDFMSFSRRIGELWEKFCSIAWDFSQIIQRFDAPHFSCVKQEIIDNIKDLSSDSNNHLKIINIVEELLYMVGDISLKEDEMFYKNNHRYVIDFKSGFGSNEKGNMLRLQAVGNAYKKYDPNTTLLLLVRQTVNNNYLNVLRQNNIWEIHTGNDAYTKIYQLTNVNILWVVKNVINFENDLDPQFIYDLKNTSGDLLNYLKWN